MLKALNTSLILYTLPCTKLFHMEFFSMVNCHTVLNVQRNCINSQNFTKQAQVIMGSACTAGIQRLFLTIYIYINVHPKHPTSWASIVGEASNGDPQWTTVFHTGTGYFT